MTAVLAAGRHKVSRLLAPSESNFRPVLHVGHSLKVIDWRKAIGWLNSLHELWVSVVCFSFMAARKVFAKACHSLCDERAL
jgi:hypothetical protein